MNKFAAIILLAFIGCVLAQEHTETNIEDDEEYSALSLIPDDDEEVRYLSKENKIFSDFCVQSRDEIKKFLQESANTAAAGIFDAIFSSIGDVGKELIMVERDAITKGADLIKRNVVAEPDDVLPSKSEVKENLKENAQRMSLVQAATNAVKVVIHAVIEATKTQVFMRIALLRSRLDGETMRTQIDEACKAVSYDLQRRIENKLTSAKSEIRASGSKAQFDAIAKLKPEQVGCLSTGRVNKVTKFCDVLKLAGSAIFPMLGL